VRGCRRGVEVPAREPVVAFHGAGFRSAEGGGSRRAGFRVERREQDWANDASGNSGKITALNAFTATDDRPCKRLKLDARSVEFDGSWNVTVCRNTDGDWRIDPNAKPK